MTLFSEKKKKRKEKKPIYVCMYVCMPKKNARVQQFAESRKQNVLGTDYQLPV